MVYNWGIKELLEEKKELLKRYKYETNPSIKKELLSVIYNLNETIKEEKGQDEEIVYLTDEERLDNIRSDIERYKAYYSIVSFFQNSLSKHYDKIDYLEELMIEKVGLNESYGKITGAKVSNDRAFALTNLFYKRHIPSLYPIFESFYKKRFNSVRFIESISDQTVANAKYIWPTKRYFMNCLKDDDISKISNLIHEYGHIISFALNPKELYYPRYPMFAEVASIFPEIIALYENDGHHDETQLLYERYCNLPALLGNSIQLVLHSVVLNLWEENNYQLNDKFFHDLDYYYDTDKEEFDSVLNTYIDNQGIYIVSYMVAIELFHLYKIDKNKALKIFESILRFPYDGNLKEYICSVLNIGEHLEEESALLIDDLSLALKRKM